MEWRKRGTLLVRGPSFGQSGLRMRAWPWSRSLRLAGVAVTVAEETKHFKLIGTTGSGKSTAIAQLLQGALQRGDRAVIADPDGGYLARFHDSGRGDIILNPFELRSMKWDPFSEVQDSYDLEQLATGLIPASGDGSNQEWRGYARTFLTAVARCCHHRGRRDTAELWRLLAIATSRELRAVVAGTPAQPFLEQDNARMFGSIRSITGSVAAALAHVQAQRGRAFSVRSWIRSGRGVLFMPYRANQIAALRSLIATWMRLAVFEAMNRSEEDHRLWFVMDELDALGAIDGLKDALARLRKFGGRCLLGFQSVAQVTSTYGSGDAQTLLENCGNTLILRCSGSDSGGTARFASRLIGEREMIRRQTSHTQDRLTLLTSYGARRSRNTSEQHVTEPAVMPSEIEQLPDLTGYLKTASSRAWRHVRIRR